MKRILTIVLMVLIVSLDIIAQQLPKFTQYMYNIIAINPIYAGTRDALSIVGLNRNQWAGFDGGPQTQILSIHSPLRNEQVGIGLSLFTTTSCEETFSISRKNILFIGSAFIFNNIRVFILNSVNY
jgi:type IX secretion system PorP/SprF family membrane protein